MSEARLRELQDIYRADGPHAHVHALIGVALAVKQARRGEYKGIVSLTRLNAADAKLDEVLR